MKKRVMIVGPTQCGKSTIANILNETDRPLKKSQDIIYGKNTIDIPGSYIENSYMNRYIISSAQNASCIIFIVDQTNIDEIYPPGFAKTFTVPVIGVITKKELAPEKSELSVAKLKRIGVSEPYLWFSDDNKETISILKNHLKQYCSFDSEYENYDIYK